MAPTLANSIDDGEGVPDVGVVCQRGVAVFAENTSAPGSRSTE
jgi:hypothetical protein